MKTKVISVNNAIPGMIVAEDILTFNNILLSDSGSPLTDRVITRLKFYNIDEITIIYDEEETALEEPTVSTPTLSTSNVIPSKEFKEFNTAMTDFG